MIKKIILHYRPLFILFLLAVLLFVPWRQAQAADWNCLINLPKCFITSILSFWLTFVGWILSGVAESLDWFLKYQNNWLENVTVVEESWKTLRDFANMFFILFLIVIAFATIFDYQKYNWRGLLPKFLIAALLINFSLAIGYFLIKVATNLSTVILNEFQSVSGSLADGFALHKILSLTERQSQSASLTATLTQATVTYVFVGIIAGIVVLAFLSAFIFSVVRIPVLWALLIISPLAWAASVLPNTRGQFSKWWKWFIGWTFFLPIYLFMLLLGVIILNNRPDLSTAGAQASILGLTIEEIFYYVLTLILLIGGLAASLKFSFFSGTKVTETFGAVSGAVNNWASRRLYVTAAKKAAQEKLTEVQEKGLPGRWSMLYGGKRADVLREAQMRQLLGLEKGAVESTKRAQFNEDIKKAYEAYGKQNLDQAGITLLMNQRSQLTDAQFIALAKMRAENGWIPRGANGQREIEETVKILGEKTKEGQDYIRTLVKNDFTDAFGSQTEMENFVRTTASTALKRAGIETMAKNNDILSDDLLQKGLELFANESVEKRKAVEKELQKNIKNIKRTKKERKAYLQDATKNREVRRLFAQQMAEDDEINNYNEYQTATELWGGEREFASRQLRSKIAVKDKMADAEISFREDLGRVDPASRSTSYLPVSAAEKASFVNKLLDNFQRMSAKEIAETDRFWWSDPRYKDEVQTALQERVSLLQRRNPPVTRMVRDRRTGRLIPKIVPGGGEIFKLNLQKIVQGTPEKVLLVNSLIIP